MQKMFKVGSAWMLGAAIVAVMFVATPKQAEARPPFVGVFAKQYPALKDLVKKSKCAVCHPKADNKKKKKRNDYGMALGKAIGKANEKDKAKVTAALVKIEKEKSGAKGKTFGDLIKEGKLPGDAK
ncbi:MAG: hypothetical protein HON53_12625 [Planctomycetaceae bacterium]|jgi:hypothetical protein|nr:hypothetical protein [Planctomycetaceae bacterium]MBT6154504.1 hypothetical protein [Planctomycetaceae bacterium]MBT6486534.1 hypothetical protein [Planctomycetaceae bacterium]MBT6497961.1 hypothetical protein [Planctomycetaceae bacterium]